MPGPLSAPNGDARLVRMSAEQRAKLFASKKLVTGKTARKRGNKEVAPMPRI